jgi:hypothetical protein
MFELVWDLVCSWWPIAVLAPRLHNREGVPILGAPETADPGHPQTLPAGHLFEGSPGGFPHLEGVPALAVHKAAPVHGRPPDVLVELEHVLSPRWNVLHPEIVVPRLAVHRQSAGQLVADPHIKPVISIPVQHLPPFHLLLQIESHHNHCDPESD